MKLFNDVEKIANSLQSYNGLNGAKQINNGFVVAFKISDKILDLSSRGHRPRKVEVAVSRDRVESSRDFVSIKESDRNIVGLSQLVNSSRAFIKANNLSCVNMSLSLLEIKDCKKMYIQMIEFTYR